MGKSYYDKDFESVLKDFEKNNPLKKGETPEAKNYFKSAGQFPAVNKNPDTSSFLKRRIALSGPIGKAVAAGALAGSALEAGIQKIKSMKGKEAEPEIPSGTEVTGKAKGGYVKKPYRTYNGKF